MDKKERIDAVRRLYYSNPKVQEALLKFSKDREVVPKYFEGFGKRPDALQYISDIMNLVKKGATSFHCSEELWEDPLKLSSEISQEEMSELRKGWDLLIDVDSKYLDYSKIAAKLIIKAFEEHGIKNYGIKFSGSKGFHIILSGKAFPEIFDGQNTREMFPEWARAICEYLIEKIRPEYNKIISEGEVNFEAIKERTNLSKADLMEIRCPECGSEGKKGKIVVLKCPECGTIIERPNPKTTKRKLMCFNEGCAGKLEVVKEEDYFYCEKCKYSSRSKMQEESDKNIVYTKEAREAKYSEDFEEQVSGHKLAGLDLVLVAPRHLFRMPYSLHEKTALASIVLTKEEIENFNPQDADPLKVNVKDFMPVNETDEAKKLIIFALEFKKRTDKENEESEKKRYSEYGKGEKAVFEDIKMEDVKEEMFPKPIKKLLKGLKDGKKRGLFVLITFLRSIGYSPEKINDIIKEWNKKNEPPLREGYIKTQIDWHIKQKRKILPPNYSNDAFYKDLGLLEGKVDVKNPLVEVLRAIRKVKQQ